jgi:hypothetical protein
MAGHLAYHSGSAYQLATFPELADFTSGTLADEEEYRADGYYYHQGESR